MADWVSIPVGIDIGTTRIRLALGERHREGHVRVRAIASREISDGPLSDAIGDLLREVGSKERRCVLGVGAPAASLRYVKFPKMSWTERLRAARFEVARWPGFDAGPVQTIVRVHPVSRHEGIYAVGAASATAIEELIALAKASKMRIVAIDHDACALRRLFPQVDAVVDVGAERTVVHAFGQHGPLTAVVDAAGNQVTRDIARELSIDLVTAEKRKRILGCAGAGAHAQDAVIAGIAAVVERLRARVTIERIAVTGNGARLPSFLADLQDATGTQTEMPVPELLLEPYPADVVRTAAPDWSLAAGLLAWSAAA